MHDVTVVVATFGAPEWERMALERAVPSAEAEGVSVVHVHGDSLHEARNAGLALVNTEFVCFLDGDDELEPGFFTAIADAPMADVRAPSIRYLHPGRYRSTFGEAEGAAVMPQVVVHGHQHQCHAECLAYGNWVVVGAPARTELVRAVGGFGDWLCAEDWALWISVWQAGGTFAQAPAAVYRSHVLSGSRNRMGGAVTTQTYTAIAAHFGLPQQ